MRVRERLKGAWNAFKARDETVVEYFNVGTYSSVNPSRARISSGNERSIINAVLNRIALDVSAYDIFHIRTDAEGQYEETIKSGLNNCLTVEANKDQTGRALLQDIVMSMFDEGHVAIVPVDTTISPIASGAYEIHTMRTGKVVEWYPDHIKVEIYNDQIGRKERVLLPKSMVAIVENPLYPIMNEPNSTLKRLIRKLNILDVIDEQSGSGKLDLIIQLPYVIKTAQKEDQAEKRRKSIETQLAGSKYGVAYTDGTERITQLNRPAENNLLSQIEFLTKMLYNQLGISESVFDGTADSVAMLNYQERTVSVVVTAIVEELNRKFLTKTARAQGQKIMSFRDMFRFVPVSEMATMADTFTRNEIMSSNEIRVRIGMKPSKAPNADELRNKNMPKVDTESQENNEFKPQEDGDLNELV